MRILLVVHGFPPQAHGGTEVYAHQQARLLAAGGDDVSVFTRRADAERPEYAIEDETREGVRIRSVNRTFRDVRSFADLYASEPVTARLAEFVEEVRPDVAHIHHLTCLSTTIVDALKRRHVPTVLTLHDYWMLCHRGQLLDLDLRRCNDPRTCRRCIGPAGDAGSISFGAANALRAVRAYMPEAVGDALHAAAATAADAVFTRSNAAEEGRFEHMQAILAKVDRLVAPSQYLIDRFAAAGLEEDIQFLEYGTDVSRFHPGQHGPPAPLRVGFLGSLMVSKAPHLLLEAKRLLRDDRVAIEIAGAFAPYHGDSSYERILKPLLADPGVHVRGPLAHEDVPAFLSGLDVLVIPSIWEENSPLVIREAFASGVPVVASRIGGIPETVSHDVNGLLFDPGDCEDLARQLRRLVDEPGLLARLRSGIPPVHSLEQATRDTRALYLQLVAAAPRALHAPHAPQVSSVVLNFHTPDDTLIAVRALLASRRPLSSVIVVDNSDDTDCRSALADVLSSIVFLSAGANLGFSAGVNLGIRHALEHGATHVLLVNSDVVLPPTALDALVSAVTNVKGRGIAAPIILSRSFPNRVTSAGMQFSDRTGRMRHDASGSSVDGRRFPQWQSTSAVSGCAMLIAREVFDAVGLLPEPYFFSFEDLAFCLDARDHGFDVGVVGSAFAYHQGGRSLGATSVRRLYFASRNHLLAASTRPGGRMVRATRAAAVVGYNLAHGIMATGGSPVTRVAAVMRGVRDHLRGRYGADAERHA